MLYRVLMRYKAILVLFAVAVAFVLSCKKSNPDKQQGDQNAAKYAANINIPNATQYLSIIAGDDYEGRETGKPGADKTAGYIAGKFQEMGLEAPVNGSYFFDVPLVENQFVVSSFTVNGTAYTNGTDFYAKEGVAGNTINASEILFVGYGIDDPAYDDFNGIDIAGKVILFINDGEPTNNGISRITHTAAKSSWTTDPNLRIQNLRSRGPALILAANPRVLSGIAKFGDHIGGNRQYIKGKQLAPPSNTPVFNISPAIADNLLKNAGLTYAGLKNGIDQTGQANTQVISAAVSTSYTTQLNDVHAVEVLGYLPGTDLKDEVLVISAHYDHLGLLPTGTDQVFNGADDDGSGITGVLSIAKAFTEAKKAGHGPRRSILFLGNVGEEKGLLGSSYYTDHPVFPMANTITNLNMDMIGRISYEYIGRADSVNNVYLVGSSRISHELHDISEHANATNTYLELNYDADDPNDPNMIYYRSDHYNFAKHGVPVIFYFDGGDANYHRPTDELHTINFGLLVKRAQLVYYTAWELANRDKRPQ